MTGQGTLSLQGIDNSGAAVGNLSGQVSVLGGTLFVASSQTLGTDTGANQTLYIDGGQLRTNYSGTETRNITLGGAGGSLGTNSNTIFSGNVTGSGFLRLYNSDGGGSITLSGTGNTYSGGTLVNANKPVIVAAGSSVGSGDVAVINGYLAIQSDTGINSSAHLAINPGAAVYIQSDTQSIGSLEGSGNVVLGGVDDTQNASAYSASTININTPLSGGTGTGDARTTLTVGNNNASTTFDGIIMDSVGTQGSGRYANIATPRGDGYLVKVGTGNLTLSNMQAYSGTTTVNNGTLTVQGSIPTASAVFRHQHCFKHPNSEC